jgi:pyridoxamine 5'-phosphate oxidase-like protein
MANREPVAELDARFSSEDATAREWSEGRRYLDRAEVYWISTVRLDGRPHVTPLIAVWLYDALYFCTGPTSARPGTSRGTRTASSSPGATRSARGADQPDPLAVLAREQTKGGRTWTGR